MKKAKWLELSALLFVISGFQACVIKECDECVNPPQPIFIKIVDANENNLITSGLYKRDSLKLYYFDGTQRKDVVFEITLNEELPNIIISSEMSWKCIDQRVDYFLYLNYLDTDTLSLEVQKHSDDCCTSYPIKSFEINGDPAEMSNIDYTFLIRKTGGR